MTSEFPLAHDWHSLIIRFDARCPDGQSESEFGSALDRNLAPSVLAHWQLAILGSRALVCRLEQAEPSDWIAPDSPSAR